MTAARITIEVSAPDANGQQGVRVHSELPPAQTAQILENAIRAVRQPPRPSGIEIATPEVAKQLLAR